VTDSSDSDHEATAEDETPRGAAKPEELDGRGGEERESEIPPEVRDDDDFDRDMYGEAREIVDPDQHRDEEEYDCSNR
jgi:hypothetical protein